MAHPAHPNPRSAKISAELLKKLRPEAKPYDVRDTSLKGFILRVESGGTKTYYFEYRCLGVKKRGPNTGKVVKRQDRYKIGCDDEKTADEARDEAKKINGFVGKGNEIRNDPKLRDRTIRATESEVPSLGWFLENDYSVHKIAKHGKRGTQDIDRLKKCFPVYLTYQLNAITARDIEKWRSQRIVDGRKPATVNRDIAVLKAALYKAVDLEIIASNPLRRVKDFELDNGRVRSLSPAERTSLFDTLDKWEAWKRANTSKPFPTWVKETAGTPVLENPDEFAHFLKPVVLLALNTGIRRGNMLALKWGDVDLNRRQLKLRADVSKSGRTHVIPLNQTATDALTKWHTQLSYDQKTAASYVFASRDGTQVDKDNLDRLWRPLLKVAEIEDFKWHDMRHDFATEMVTKSKSLYTAQRLLGHQSPRMTQRYAHLADEELAKAVALLDPLPTR